MGHGGAGWEVGEVTHPWDGHWVQGPWGRNCSCSPVPLLHPLWDLGCDTKRCRLAAKLGSSSFSEPFTGILEKPWLGLRVQLPARETLLASLRALYADVFHPRKHLGVLRCFWGDLVWVHRFMTMGKHKSTAAGQVQV